MSEQIKKSKKDKAKLGDKIKGLKNKTVVLNPTVLVLTTYILLLLSKIIDLTLINRENQYFSVVILQMMIFLLPGAIWCRFSGEKYTKNLRLKMIRPGSIVITVAAAFFMISGGLLISVLFGGLESLSDNFSLYNTFVSRDDGTVPAKIYLVVAYAILPAICEEFVYRGILCHEYEKGGVMRAVVLSSVFFGLLHFNLQNLPVYIFSGVVLALTLYATRSLFGSILAHMIYNVFGLFGQRYMSSLYNMTGSTKFFIFMVTLVFLVSGIIFCAEASRLYKKYLYRGYSAKYRQPALTENKDIKNSYLEVLKLPSTVACILVYIIALVISWL
ncbi:MAG: CPBP family intramembrane metalloprotease [Clostridia bacterium]|nr:CPBP family intramembrane metalloprotease [Clostridia bacterium]